MIDAYQPTSDLVHEQVARYEATDGREGGTLEDWPVIILTTSGAKTGNIRKTRIKDGDTYVAVASNGGASNNPSTYRYLIAHPEVSLQDGATVYWRRAREVRGEEKARPRLVAQYNWTRYPEFRAKAGDREIPVIALEPAQTRTTAAGSEHETGWPGSNQ